MIKKGVDDFMINVGERFFRLVVLKLDHVNNHGTKYYLCKCDCGNYKVVEEGHLKKGDTKSCGCWKEEARKTCDNMTGTRFHNIWRSMIQRCRDEHCKVYKYYGGRGIKVCNSWKNFINFKKDMYDSYLQHSQAFSEKETTIDRIDNNKDYCKENCRWATKSEQQKNKRNIIYVRGNKNEDFTSLMDYCKMHNLNYSKIYWQYTHNSKLFNLEVKNNETSNT